MQRYLCTVLLVVVAVLCSTCVDAGMPEPDRVLMKRFDEFTAPLRTKEEANTIEGTDINSTLWCAQVFRCARENLEPHYFQKVFDFEEVLCLQGGHMPQFLGNAVTSNCSTSEQALNVIFSQAKQCLLGHVSFPNTTVQRKNFGIVYGPACGVAKTVARYVLDSKLKKPIAWNFTWDADTKIIEVGAQDIHRNSESAVENATIASCINFYSLSKLGPQNACQSYLNATAHAFKAWNVSLPSKGSCSSVPDLACAFLPIESCYFLFGQASAKAVAGFQGDATSNNPDQGLLLLGIATGYEFPPGGLPFSNRTATSCFNIPVQTALESASGALHLLIYPPV